MKDATVTTELVSVYRALASRQRLKILSLLAKRPLCVNAIARSLKISQPAVSQHLEVLRGAQLVVGDRSGVMVHYRMDRERLQAVRDLTAFLLRESKETAQPGQGG